MSTPGGPEPKASYRQIEGLAQSREAIDAVIATAAKSICIFDHNLELRGYGDAARIERLRGVVAPPRGLAHPRIHRGRARGPRGPRAPLVP